VSCVLGSPVDTGRVFKQLVRCFTCEDEFYFTLRAIVEDRRVVCPLCGGHINLTNAAYQPLIANAKATLETISRETWIDPLMQASQALSPYSELHALASASLASIPRANRVSLPKPMALLCIALLSLLSILVWVAFIVRVVWSIFG